MATGTAMAMVGAKETAWIVDITTLSMSSPVNPALLILAEGTGMFAEMGSALLQKPVRVSMIVDAATTPNAIQTDPESHVEHAKMAYNPGAMLNVSQLFASLADG